jgi:endonuclease YncB( thermonuclease family)
MGMRGLIFTGFLALLALAGSADAAPKSKKAPGGQVFTAQVVRILDGDTVVLADDRRVRLLDINAPELSHDGRAAEPYGLEASRYLKSLVFGQTLTFQTGAQPTDRFGRVLAQAYLPGGGWVNGTMVRDGFAHVYTFADNAMYPQQLLAYEAQARAAKRGLWALNRWQVRDAAKCCSDEDVGTFKLVEGTVRTTALVKRPKYTRTYLNFGSEWRTDFSAFVDKRDEKYFRKVGIDDIGRYYKGKHVRVRGQLQPVNGVLVRVTHPAQIEVIDDGKGA